MTCYKLHLRVIIMDTGNGCLCKGEFDTFDASYVKGIKISHHKSWSKFSTRFLCSQEWSKAHSWEQKEWAFDHSFCSQEWLLLEINVIVIYITGGITYAISNATICWIFSRKFQCPETLYPIFPFFRILYLIFCNVDPTVPCPITCLKRILKLKTQQLLSGCRDSRLRWSPLGCQPPSITSLDPCTGDAVTGHHNSKHVKGSEMIGLYGGNDTGIISYLKWIMTIDSIPLCTIATETNLVARSSTDAKQIKRIVRKFWRIFDELVFKVFLVISRSRFYRYYSISIINCSRREAIIVNVCVFFFAKFSLHCFDFSSDFYALDFLCFVWSKILSQSQFQAAELNWRQFNTKSEMKSAPKLVPFLTLNPNSGIC